MSPNDSTDLDRLEDLTQAIVSLAKLDFSVQLNVQGSSPLDHDRWSGNGAEPELHATPWLAGPSMFSVPAPRVRASRGPIRRTASKTMPATASLPTSAPTEDLPLLVKRDVLVAWWHEDTAYSDNHLYKCYAAILRKALVGTLREGGGSSDGPRWVRSGRVQERLMFPIPKGADVVFS